MYNSLLSMSLFAKTEAHSDLENKLMVGYQGKMGRNKLGVWD